LKKKEFGGQGMWKNGWAFYFTIFLDFKEWITEDKDVSGSDADGSGIERRQELRLSASGGDGEL
jgi:hypothetical protein